MQRQPEKQARAEAILGELAELGLAMARDLAVRVRECEDPAEAERLAAAFNKTSRAVRLTLALDFKLERDAARLAREDREAADAQAQAEAKAAEARARADREAAWTAAAAPVRARKDRVRNLLNRLIWDESEGDSAEYEVLLDDLEARLDEAARRDDFQEIPIEILAGRMAAQMRLSGELLVGEAGASGSSPTGGLAPRSGGGGSLHDAPS